MWKSKGKGCNAPSFSLVYDNSYLDERERRIAMKYIRKPSIDMYEGIVVTSETELNYETEYVKQELKNLTFHTVTEVIGDGFKSVYDTTIYLNEGDVLIYDGEGRGYVKPVESFVTVEEAIADLECIKEM